MSGIVRDRVSPIRIDAGIASCFLLALTLAATRLPRGMFFHAAFVLAIVYVFRWRTFGVARGTWGAFFVLLATCVSLLPYVYANVAEWENRHVLPFANWLGTPIALYAVPMASGLRDVGQRAFPTLLWYLIRSVLELTLLVPLWIFMWAFFEVWFLGWVWI